MKINWINVILATIVILFFASCEKDHIVQEGMKPIYSSFDDFSNLKSGPPMPYNNLGKIVSSGAYIFINERGKGIHVIDNNDPNFPVQLYFWHIIGNTEFTILHQVLYANNGKHLLAIDISNFANITLSNVLKNQYQPELLELYPENYNGFFECYDSTLGNFIGWEKSKLINPNCETN